VAGGLGYALLNKTAIGPPGFPNFVRKIEQNFFYLPPAIASQPASRAGRGGQGLRRSGRACQSFLFTPMMAL